MSGDVAERWPTVRLDEVADLCLGKMLDKEKNRGEPRPYLANMNVRWGSFDLQDVRAMPFEERELERYGLRSGDIVMCEGGEPGRCAIWTDEVPGMMIQKALHRVRPMEGTDSHYLYYALAHGVRSGSFDELMTGSGIKHLPGNQVAKLEVLTPPLDEQRRIAEVLRSVDEAISANEAVASQGLSCLDALLNEYFSPNEEHATQSELVPLSDLIAIQSGFAFKSEDYQQHGHYLMRISNVQDGKISLENPKFVKLDKKTRSFELQDGDILTSLTGNIGRVARLTGDQLPAALNQRVARITPRSDVSVDPDYLFFALKSPLFKASLAQESGGAAQQNVSPKAIGRVEIPLPMIEEQKFIGEMLLGLDAAMVQSEKALERLRNVKSSLMSDLLFGHVRVPA